jgi:hypothetical protein
LAISRPRSAGAASLALLLLMSGTAAAIDIAPHRATYTMTLGSTKQGSGVVAVQGTMVFEWGETESCDAWTVEQRYRMQMRYAEDTEVELTSNFVTWESKDGLRYRFFERKMKDGDLDEEVRGEAALKAAGKGGTVEFSKPNPQTMELAPGVIFPTAHTLLLLERAASGEQFVGKKVFDGASEENAVDVTAVIGAPQSAEAGAAESPIKSPLLAQQSWRMRLAFFPPDGGGDKPDYELGMRLLQNGVSRDMLLDYGDFAIKATLDQIEALPKPKC